MIVSMVDNWHSCGVQRDVMQGWSVLFLSYVPSVFFASYSNRRKKKGSLAERLLEKKKKNTRGRRERELGHVLTWIQQRPWNAHSEETTLLCFLGRCCRFSPSFFFRCCCVFSIAFTQPELGQCSRSQKRSCLPLLTNALVLNPSAVMSSLFRFMNPLKTRKKKKE